MSKIIAGLGEVIGGLVTSIRKLGVTGMLGVGALVVVIIAVNLIHGRAGGVFSFHGSGRFGTWVATLALLTIVFVLIGRAIKNRWDGIFIDTRNKISLSRYQLIIWTILIAGSLVTAALANISLESANPLEIKIPPEIWALLGLGGFTFVASPAILAQKERSGRELTDARLAQINADLRVPDRLSKNMAAIGPVVYKASPADARWLDMFRGDESDANIVDFSKVQQFIFTVLLWFIYATALARLFMELKPITAFPAIDAGFIALLGVSHAAYLAYKASPKA